MSEIPLMVMPWHRPDPCKPLKMQTDAAFKSHYLDYLATLRLDSPPLEIPLTTIAGTIGPASNNLDMLVELMKEGMSIALVPLALGTRQDQLDTIANIRTANTSFTNMRGMVYPLGIAVQTKGPGLRLGGLHKDLPLTLPLHHKLTLTTDKSWRMKGNEHYLYINFPEMCNVLDEGDILLLGGGIVILQVEFVGETEVKCVVSGAGNIQSFMSVTVPDVPLNLPPLTDEDVDDLKMAAEIGVDIVVVSHAQTHELVKDVRKLLDEQDGGPGIKIWAQIESNQALNNLEYIMEVADAVVFSRISFLQDITTEKLFLAQKIVMATCNKKGVPVFVSSHFLPSMQVSTTPSIAEVYDVATAILDGVDGFLMRNTVSHGKHPDLALRTMSTACREAEAAVWHHQTFTYLNTNAPAPIDPTHSIAIAAVDASLKSNATAIFLATTSGRSAQLVARYRPRCPIIAITRYGQVARQLNSWRAIIPLHYIDPPLPEWTREVDLRFQFGIEFAKHKGIVHPGDVLVLLNGWRQGAGFTNTIRIVYASESFPWVYPHKLPSTIPSDTDVKQEEDKEGEEATRAKTAGGEPGQSASRLVTIKESSTRSLSLASRIATMQSDYMSMSLNRSKEMEEKLVESLQSLRPETKITKTVQQPGTVMERPLTAQPSVASARMEFSGRKGSEGARSSLLKSSRSTAQGSILQVPSKRPSQNTNDMSNSSAVSPRKSSSMNTKTVMGTKTVNDTKTVMGTRTVNDTKTVMNTKTVMSKAPTVLPTEMEDGEKSDVMSHIIKKEEYEENE